MLEKQKRIIVVFPIDAVPISEGFWVLPLPPPQALFARMTSRSWKHLSSTLEYLTGLLQTFPAFGSERASPGVYLVL